MIITPNSSTNRHASGGDLEATATNFPSCKMFFPCDETSGTTLTDAIAGSVITMPGTISNSAGIITTAGGTAAEVTLASTIPIAAKSALFIVAGTFGAVTIFKINEVAGAASGGVIQMSTLTNSLVTDGTNTATSAAAVTASSAIAAAMLYTPGTSGEGQAIECDATTYTAATAVNGAPGDITTMPTMSYLNLQSTGASFNLGGIGFFVFDSTPSATLINAIVAECASNWLNNRKWLPATLKGVA